MTAGRAKSPGRRLAVRRSRTAPAGHPSASRLLDDLLAHLRALRTALDRGLPFPSEGVTEVRDLLVGLEHGVEALKLSGRLGEGEVAVLTMVCLNATDAVLRVAASAHRRTGSRHTGVGVN